MTTDVEIALFKVGTDDFEKVASDVLRDYGYDVNPSGIQGTDTGRDAFVEINGEPGIAHYSTRKRWRRKLREDAGKAAKHEEGYEWFVLTRPSCRWLRMIRETPTIHSTSSTGSKTSSRTILTTCT